jgi:SAM-dependent methyltransferase
MAKPMTGLRPEQDAYGQILLARFEGRGGQEIMEREDGLIYCGDPGDYFAPFRRWPPVERRAMRFVRGRVLDVGCGAGRVALHLQERGHEVLAIDESPLAVEVARKRGVEHAEVLPVGEVGPALGRFDTIVLMRNNFGLAGPEARSPRLLRELLALTSEDARIVTDSVDPGRIDDPEHAWTANRGLRMRVRWLRYASPWFHYLMLAPPELERLVVGSGWHVARFLDDGTPRYAAILERDPRPAVSRRASSPTSRRPPRSAAAAPSARSGTARAPQP